jgi:NAD(P)-dependent dehydrogenase (short-subunit alcohol dehydrogenase family)
MDETIWDKTMAVNAKGVFLVGRWIPSLPVLRPSQSILPTTATGTASVANTHQGCKHALSQFLSQPPHPSGSRGWIINISSIFGLSGFPGGHGPYCASKAACLNLTKSIALDYAADKIHCNAICPGFTQTAMTEETFGDEEGDRGRMEKTPWGRWGKASEIADCAVWLASGESSFVTGVGVPVDGGYMAL